jgi:YD repeat-containing protein
MSDRQQLLGAWRLVSREEESEQGVAYTSGQDEIGQISYDASGRMSAQFMSANQARFANEDWRESTPQERTTAWLNYFGYFGRFTVDADKKIVVHQIEGSWFPNLVGTEQIRHYRFKGKQLVLDANTPWGNVRIVWEKYDSPA